MNENPNGYPFRNFKQGTARLTTPCKHCGRMMGEHVRGIKGGRNMLGQDMPMLKCLDGKHEYEASRCPTCGIGFGAPTIPEPELSAGGKIKQRLARRYDAARVRIEVEWDRLMTRLEKAVEKWL
jgi:hypothetical protein